MRIIAFNTAVGWSRDVTMDIDCGVPRGVSLGAGIPRDGCPGALSLASFGVHKVWERRPSRRFVNPRADLMIRLQIMTGERCALSRPPNCST